MPRKKRYYEKNRRFEVWLPDSLFVFFEDYLQHYCQGEKTPNRFRVFLYELESLEHRGITIANPIKAYEADRRKELEQRYGRDFENLCIRHLTFKGKNQHEREMICGKCKETHPIEFKACQSIRRDIEQEKVKAGI